MELQNLNGWAILVAFLSAYFLGAIWYAPKVFGNAWMNALGKQAHELGSPAKAMGVTLVTTLLSTIVLALLINVFRAQSIVTTGFDGVWFGALLAFGIYGLTTYSDSLFCGWPGRVLLIQIAYRVVKFMVMGFILATWT